MGRGNKLNESACERKQILELKQQQSSVGKISKVIMKKSRSNTQFLRKNIEDYGEKKKEKYRSAVVNSQLTIFYYAAKILRG